MHVIKIATLNINGITAPTRVGMLSDFITRHQLDILFVQGVTNPNTLNIRGYDTHRNIGTPMRETAILVKNAMSITIVHTWGDPKNWTGFGEHFLIVVECSPLGECSCTLHESVARADIAVEGCTGLCCQFFQVLSSFSREIVMSDRTEHRICLRFCFRLGKTATEAHEMLQKAFKEEALSRTHVFEWFARFKRGEMSVEDRPHSGRPSTSRSDVNVEKSRHKFNEDRRYTIDETSEAMGVSWCSFQRILTVDMNMRRVAAKFVPRQLRTKKKHNRLTLCQDLKNQIESETFFLRSSRVTKVGAMGTTLRTNKLRANGRRPLNRDRKKQDK